jgi:hypothetical protein
MNAPDLHRAILRHHIAAVEARIPIKIVGVLPRGSAAHVADERAIHLLAEKRAGLDLLGLAAAEVALGDLLGRPVGLVLASGLQGDEAQQFPALVEPL